MLILDSTDTMVMLACHWLDIQPRYNQKSFSYNEVYSALNKNGTFEEASVFSSKIILMTKLMFIFWDSPWHNQYPSVSKSIIRLWFRLINQDNYIMKWIWIWNEYVIVSTFQFIYHYIGLLSVYVSLKYLWSTIHLHFPQMKLLLSNLKMFAV